MNTVLDFLMRKSKSNLLFCWVSHSVLSVLIINTIDMYSAHGFFIVVQMHVVFLP